MEKKPDVSLSSLMRRLSNEGIPVEKMTEMAQSIRKDIMRVSERSPKKGLAAAIRHKDHRWAEYMVREYKMSHDTVNNAIKIAYIEVRGNDPKPPEICDEIRSIYLARDNLELKEMLDSFDDLIRQVWLKRNGLA